MRVCVKKKNPRVARETREKLELLFVRVFTCVFIYTHPLISRARFEVIGKKKERERETPFIPFAWAILQSDLEAKNSILVAYGDYFHCSQ